tara:strand:+ start:890 stop:1033 length:144 start_codon:yes stop_codon:yes gene_type:complete
MIQNSKNTEIQLAVKYFEEKTLENTLPQVVFLYFYKIRNYAFQFLLA